MCDPAPRSFPWVRLRSGLRTALTRLAPTATRSILHTESCRQQRTFRIGIGKIGALWAASMHSRRSNGEGKWALMRSTGWFFPTRVFRAGDTSGSAGSCARFRMRSGWAGGSRGHVGIRDGAVKPPRIRQTRGNRSFVVPLGPVPGLGGQGNGEPDPAHHGRKITTLPCGL